MIIKRETYEKRINAAIEVGRRQGFKEAVVGMVSNNTIIHKKGEGYGSCNKIEVDINDEASVAAAAEEISNGR